MKRVSVQPTPIKAVATMALIAACALPLLLVSAASATITTVGRPFSGTYTTSAAKAEPFIGTNWAFPDTGGAAFSPISGTIIRWSVTGAQGSFRLGTMTKSANQYTLTRLGDAVSPLGTGNESFATAIPITAGELVAVEVAASSTIGTVPELAGASVFLQPTPAIGELKSPNKGPSETLWGFNAEVLPPPTINSVTPTTGSTGSTVAISGQNFAQVSAVKFGSNAAASFTVANETTINAVVPAGTGGAPITVTTPAGTATSVIFTSVAPPPPPPSAMPSPPATCTVPKLRGKTLKAAKTRIRSADCKVGKLTKRRGATAKDGEVVQQVPKPGATVPASTQVKVTLAP